MNLATIGTAIWGFLKRIPDWVLWLLAAIIFLKFVDMRAERRGREKEATKRDKQEVAEREVLNETITTLGQETEDAKDRAIAAPDAVDDVGSADELRERYPANASVILRPRPPSS